MLGKLFAGGGIQRTVEVREARHVADDARLRVDSLVYDIEKALMITEALWSMVKEQHGYTDNELLKRIMEIDVRDGKLDGKVAKTGPMTCPECGRKTSGKRPLCLYCGAIIKRDPFRR